MTNELVIAQKKRLEEERNKARLALYPKLVEALKFAVDAAVNGSSVSGSRLATPWQILLIKVEMIEKGE